MHNQDILLTYLYKSARLSHSRLRHRFRCLIAFLQCIRFVGGQVFLKKFLQFVSDSAEELHNFTKVFLIFVGKQSFSLVFVSFFFFIRSYMNSLIQ